MVRDFSTASEPQLREKETERRDSKHETERKEGQQTRNREKGGTAEERKAIDSDQMTPHAYTVEDDDCV